MKGDSMFCPSCGKETPENSKFCLHCGAPTNSVEKSSIGPSGSIQWEYKDYIMDPPPDPEAIATPDMLSTARVQWWSEVRPLVMEQLQKWYEDGWQPVSSIGPDCIEIDQISVSSCKFWNVLVWFIWFASLFTTFGLSFFFLFMRRNVYKAIGVRIQMRRPQQAIYSK